MTLRMASRAKRVVTMAMIVAASGTIGCSPVLADGVATPASYRFVDPPPFFATGNVSPHDLSTTIALGADGSAAAGIATPDGQFVIDLGRGAIAPANGATSIAVRITPIAPRHLRPLPQGRSNGNAYRVDMTYQPTGVSVTRFAKPGTLLIEIPEIGSALFVSADATRWSQLLSQPLPPRRLSVSANFPAPGYYLAATTLPELAPAAGRKHHSRLVFDLVVLGLAAGVLVGAGIVVLRRRA